MEIRKSTEIHFSQSLFHKDSNKDVNLKFEAIRSLYYFVDV